MCAISGKMSWLFLFFLLLSYTIAISGKFLHIPASWFFSLLFPVFDCYLLCLVVRCFSHVRLKFVGWLFALLAAMLFFGELFTLFYYRSFYSVYVIQLVLETDSHESREFIGSALQYPAFWHTVLCFVVVAVVSYGLARLSRKYLHHKTVLSWIVLVVILFSGIRQCSTYGKIYQTIVNPETALQNRMRSLNTTTVRILYGIAFNNAQTARLDNLQVSIEQATVDTCSFRSPLILLVIGESYNKHHAHIYNPSYLQTTPRLEALQSSGNLTVLNDVVSPYNLTSEVFKNMFSLWDDSCDGDWTCYPLFPAIFKKAGYKVWFLTNQFTIGSLNYANIVGGTIFNSPQLSDLQFSYRNRSSYDYDLELCQEFPPLDTLAAGPALVIVHLMGQHVNYSGRYPAGYEHFQPNEEPTLFGGKKGKEIACQYDNATYYNDMVVDSLFRTIKDAECVGIYLSDHGEEAYDWRSLSGRTSEADMLPEVARYQYEIPFMFYTSDTYAARHPDIVRQIRNAADRPAISSDLAHVLLYLGGINTPFYKERLNVLSPDYDMGRKRIIKGDTDYDLLMGLGQGR